MIVNAFINNGMLVIGSETDSMKSFITIESSMNDSILKDYEVAQTNDKKYIKDAIKLKEAGFTADEIIEMIGSK